MDRNPEYCSLLLLSQSRSYGAQIVKYPDGIRFSMSTVGLVNITHLILHYMFYPFLLRITKIVYWPIEWLCGVSVVLCGGFRTGDGYGGPMIESLWGRDSALLVLNYTFVKMEYGVFNGSLMMVHGHLGWRTAVYACHTGWIDFLNASQSIWGFGGDLTESLVYGCIYRRDVLRVIRLRGEDLCSGVVDGLGKWGWNGLQDRQSRMSSVGCSGACKDLRRNCRGVFLWCVCVSRLRHCAVHGGCLRAFFSARCGYCKNLWGAPEELSLGTPLRCEDSLWEDLRSPRKSALPKGLSRSRRFIRLAVFFVCLSYAPCDYLFMVVERGETSDEGGIDQWVAGERIAMWCPISLLGAGILCCIYGVLAGYFQLMGVGVGLDVVVLYSALVSSDAIGV
ncbi:hypothetical protein Tco_0331183 [Tanacetum coccineum]